MAEEEKEPELKQFTLEDIKRIRETIQAISKEVADAGGAMFVGTKLPMQDKFEVAYSVTGPKEENIYLMRFVEFQLLFREQLQMIAVPAQQGPGGKIIAPPFGFNPKKGGTA